jgi:hypothetical protein
LGGLSYSLTYTKRRAEGSVATESEHSCALAAHGRRCAQNPRCSPRAPSRPSHGSDSFSGGSAASPPAQHLPPRTCTVYPRHCLCATVSARLATARLLAPASVATSTPSNVPMCPAGFASSIGFGAEVRGERVPRPGGE